MQSKTFRYLWVISILVAATLSCSLFSNVGKRVGGLKETAQSISTSVEKGREFAITGQAVITQAEGNPLIQTAKAIITERGPSVKATAQNFATEQGPSLQKTIQAFATQQGPGLEQTIQAFATNQGPGLAQTAEAIATQAASSSGEVPSDIPVVSGEKTNFFKSESLITYFTPLDLKSVKEFYSKEMPANGWSLADTGSVTATDTAVLYFEKPDRKASLTLSMNPLDNQTIVLITIQKK